MKRRLKKVSENKKVRNATVNILDGIKFKSKLESYCYTKLKEAGIIAGYETTKFTLIDSFRYMGEAVRPMTYTPDFVGDDFVIECKGFGNDAFPLRWKIFKHWLHTNSKQIFLYLPRNKKEVNEVVEQLVKRREDGDKQVLLT